MGQAKRRGTPDERTALAIAWDEAIKEDRRRFPPSQIQRARPGKNWMAVAAMLALTHQSRGIHAIRR